MQKQQFQFMYQNNSYYYNYNNTVTLFLLSLLLNLEIKTNSNNVKDTKNNTDTDGKPFENQFDNGKMSNYFDLEGADIANADDNDILITKTINSIETTTNSISFNSYLLE